MCPGVRIAGVLADLGRMFAQLMAGADYMARAYPSPPPCAQGVYFIDRSPKHFELILNYL